MAGETKYDVGRLQPWQRWPLLEDTGELAPLWILAGQRRSGRTHAARTWARRHDRAVLFTLRPEKTPARFSREHSLPPRPDVLQGIMFDLLAIDGLDSGVSIDDLGRLADLVSARGARTLVTCLTPELPRVAFHLGCARFRSIPVITQAPALDHPIPRAAQGEGTREAEA